MTDRENGLLLHDALADRLHTLLREEIGTVLARFSYNYGPLPATPEVEQIVRSVIMSFASLPGAHWLPDDSAGGGEG